jgi:hypothetical protein
VPTGEDPINVTVAFVLLPATSIAVMVQVYGFARMPKIVCTFVVMLFGCTIRMPSPQSSLDDAGSLVTQLIVTVFVPAVLAAVMVARRFVTIGGVTSGP